LIATHLGRLSRPDQVLGHSAEPRVRRRAAGQWCRQAVQLINEGTGYSWTHLRNLEAVRAAAIAFMDRYNRNSRLEKLRFKSPFETRQERLMRLAV
jgi:hypothetical protein